MPSGLLEEGQKLAAKVREESEERLLVFWDVVELGMDKHIIGFDIGRKQARFSTPIIKLDLHSNTAITRSGTRYRFLSAPGRLHPYAKRLLKKLFNNSPLRYTLKYSHPEDKRNSLDNIEEWVKHSRVTKPRKDPYDRYKGKLIACLKSEFEDIAEFYHHLAWIDERSIYIGNTNDEFTLWNEFALRHGKSEDIQKIFLEQTSTCHLATQKASALLERGALSQVVIDPKIPIIFSRDLWDKASCLFSDMVSKLAELNPNADVTSLRLVPPSEEGMIEWAVKSVPRARNIQATTKPPKSFDTQHYLYEILDGHSRAIQDFRRSHEILSHD